MYADQVPWAHPRSRGENSLALTENLLTGGSSPLTRGKQLTEGGEVSLPGLIPAHAGKTDGCAPALVSGGAHPRSRGENGGVFGELEANRGSSPLTRGKPVSQLNPSCQVGLIPAHAGKTQYGAAAPRVR